MIAEHWYIQPEDELRKLCEDGDFKAEMQLRLAQARLVNKDAERCAMTTTLIRKLERVLGEI